MSKTVFSYSIGILVVALVTACGGGDGRHASLDLAANTADGDFDKIVSSAIEVSGENGAVVSKEFSDAFASIEYGSVSGVRTNSNIIIRSKEEFNNLWEKVHGTSVPMPDTPDIDFTKSVVAVVFMGEMESGGYSIQVKQIVVGAENLTVKVLETSPPVGAIVGPALTSPYQMIKIPVTDKKLVFVRMD